MSGTVWWGRGPFHFRWRPTTFRVRPASSRLSSRSLMELHHSSTSSLSPGLTSNDDGRQQNLGAAHGEDRRVDRGMRFDADVAGCDISADAGTDTIAGPGANHRALPR